jgi:hypothetical protein
MPIGRRVGRPGLLGAAARTAVVAGTATAVSGRVQRRAEERDLRDQQAAAYRQQQYAEPAPAPAAAPPPAQDRVAQLKDLADLKAQGLLTDEEFAAEKARVLGS